MEFVSLLRYHSSKFLDLNNLSWQRWPFALSNDGRKAWATVLFLSAIMHRNKVIHVDFFSFFCLICRTTICWDPEFFATMTTWRNDFSSLFPKAIECFHSRGQHLCKFIGTKESVYIRKEFNSHGIGLGHQHGRRFIVAAVTSCENTL